MMFAAAVGHRSGRATPSLRDAPQRQSMETTGRGPSIGTETLFRQTRPLQTSSGVRASNGRQSVMRCGLLSATKSI